MTRNEKSYPVERRGVILALALSCALSVLACNGVNSPRIAPAVSVDSTAIREVFEGKRTEANVLWWGFDAMDASAMIQAAINSPAKEVRIPCVGLPWYVQPLTLRSDLRLILDSGVTVAAIPGSFLDPTAALLKAYECSSLEIDASNASVQMRKEDYESRPYAPSQWRHCLALLGCTNVYVEGLRLMNSGGDGIYVGRSDSKVECRNITIKHVTCDGNYRNGISVISVRTLRIDSCTLMNTRGIPPQAGIDFEPNYDNESLIDCELTNSSIVSNAYFGIIVSPWNFTSRSQLMSITIANCTVIGNGGGAICFNGPPSPQGNRGYVRLIENHLYGDTTMYNAGDIAILDH